MLLVGACSTDSGSGASPTTTTESPTTTAATEPQRMYPARIAVFGDSLASEAEPYFQQLVSATGQSALAYYAHGGTAICDWLPTMRDVADGDRPVAVELQFSGNALTACMSGYAPGTEQFYARYRTDTEAAIAIFASIGAHVYLVGAPITRGQQQSDPDWFRLNEEYAAIAAEDPAHVTYIDAGGAVELPGHAYTDMLPCLDAEPCEGPVVLGTPSNTVRAPDGVHFCPVLSGDESGVIGICPVYSSGAYRYAYAMFSPLGEPS